MSEQQSGTTTATETSDNWGDPISPEGQAELQKYLDWWQAETDDDNRRGPFYHKAHWSRRVLARRAVAPRSV